MTTRPNDDDTMTDEEVDVDTDADTEEGIDGGDHADEDAGPAAPDIDPEIEQEIKKVIVEEDSPKSKAQILSDQLIHKELSPDDLFDDGSI